MKMKNAYGYKMLALVIFYFGWLILNFTQELSLVVGGYEVSLLNDFSTNSERGRLAFNAWWDTEMYRKAFGFLGLSLIVFSFCIVAYIKLVKRQAVGRVLLLLLISSVLLYLLSMIGLGMYFLIMGF